MSLDGELLNRARAIFDAHKSATTQSAPSRAAGEQKQGMHFTFF